MLHTIKNKLISLLQLILVIIYIIFEELIWEGIAKPIFEAIHSLKILQTLEKTLQEHVPASIILAFFIVLLVLSEIFGAYAGILFLEGHLMLAVGLYLFKIPIAAFTFWLFHVSEDKLMQFGWFKWLYNQIMTGIAWLKSREMYVRTMERLKNVKASIKKYVKIFKEKYLASESPFMTKMKNLYKTIKVLLKK